MKRKVSRIGPATLMISLPSRWVKLNNLKKGDEVEVDEQGKKIVVSTDKAKESEYVEIDGRNVNPALLVRYVTSAYKMGIDELKIYIDDTTISEKIQRILQKYLIGYEIIKQTKESITIKSITDEMDVEFDATLRRIFLLLLTMARESFEAAKDNDLVHLRSILKLEENNNRFTAFCRRILNKKGYKNSNKTAFVYLIVEQLEKIADEFKYVLKNYKEVKKSKKLLNPETLEVYLDVVKFLEMYYGLFYDFEKTKAIKFVEAKERIMVRSFDMLKNENDNDAVAVHHLICITQRIYDILAPLVALSLENSTSNAVH